MIEMPPWVAGAATSPGAASRGAAREGAVVGGVTGARVAASTVDWGGAAHWAARGLPSSGVGCVTVEVGVREVAADGDGGAANRRLEGLRSERRVRREPADWWPLTRPSTGSRQLRHTHRLFGLFRGCENGAVEYWRNAEHGRAVKYTLAAECSTIRTAVRRCARRGPDGRARRGPGGRARRGCGGRARRGPDGCARLDRGGRARRCLVGRAARHSARLAFVVAGQAAVCLPCL